MNRTKEQLQDAITIMRWSDDLSRVKRLTTHSDDSNETVTTHSHALALLVLAFAPSTVAHVDGGTRKLNIERCLRFAIVHDLPEKVHHKRGHDTATLVPLTADEHAAKELEEYNETIAMMHESIDDASSIPTACMEYEKGLTKGPFGYDPEAVFVYLLDKLAPLLILVTGTARGPRDAGLTVDDLDENMEVLEYRLHERFGHIFPNFEHLYSRAAEAGLDAYERVTS